MIFCNGAVDKAEKIGPATRKMKFSLAERRGKGQKMLGSVGDPFDDQADKSALSRKNCDDPLPVFVF